MLIVVGVVSTSASLGGAEFRPFVCHSEDYKDKNSAIYKWLVLFFRLSLLPLDDRNRTMSTIPDDDRCRKFADYIMVFILCIRLTLTLLHFWRYELRFY